MTNDKLIIISFNIIDLELSYIEAIQPKLT